MKSKLAQHVAFAEFREGATIQLLKKHGRVASVSYGDKDLGFVDAMGDRGLRQAHKREVNNALYLHSEFVSNDMPRPSLPTAEAIADYPDLLDKFPVAASILGFYAERNCQGMLIAQYCFPTEEERETLKYVMAVYGYLIARNERVSLLELADRIADRYDVSERRNRVAIETLRSGAGVSRYVSH